MMKNKRLFLSGVIVLLSLFVLWGCPKKAEISTSETPKDSAAAADSEKDAMKADQDKQAKQSADEAKERAAAAAAGLQPIYFDFDQSFINNDAKAVMTANAQWLKANPKVKVRIEGNCDERGTREYNQALGQRRATSAKKYLVDMGVSANRISLISYGKEKPVCGAATEDCWQKNRRDDFIAAKE